MLRLRCRFLKATGYDFNLLRDAKLSKFNAAAQNVKPNGFLDSIKLIPEPARLYIKTDDRDRNRTCI